MEPVPYQRHCPYYCPDQKWARPDVEDLKKKMRWVLENYNSALERGRKHKGLVLVRYTWEAGARDVVDVIRRLAGVDIY